MPDQPTDSARARLEQAHQLWHRALGSYPDVDEFVANVNALIPSLRTVTWVLQKAMSSVEGFDVWYAAQQDRMRSDDVMRWLVEARNHIEKQGDLDLRSTARVSVIAGWHDSPGYEFDVPPLVGPSEIAVELASRSVPDRIREEGILKVERRWVTASLPDQELLDACAHAYGVLDEVLSHAENRFSGGPAARAGKRLACMVVGPEARSALLHLASGQLVSVGRDPHPVTDADGAAAEQRYGEMIRSLGRPDNTLEGRVAWRHAFARGMFLIDGYHHRIAFLFREGSPGRFVALNPEDQQEKYVLMEALAKDVVAFGADEVIVTGEVWMALLRDAGHPDAELRAGQRPDRTEALVTYGLSREGITAALSSNILRTGEQVRLGDVEQVSAMYAQSLLPVWRAWHGRTARPPWAPEGGGHDVGDRP